MGASLPEQIPQAQGATAARTALIAAVIVLMVAQVIFSGLAIGLISLLAFLLTALILRGVFGWQAYRMRDKTIYEVKMMLDDVVRNQLTIIVMNAQMASSLDEKRVQRILDATDVIAHQLENLSDDTLDVWQTKYQHMLDAGEDLMRNLNKN
ncbi:MAG: hypothetical protein ACOCYT_00050 [Chloroflexota bacterium]